MPLIDKTDIDALNSSLSITIQKSDYESTLNEELSKYKKKAHLKGFRKGKTPMQFIKKAYGQSVLVNVINDMLQKEMVAYLQDQKINFLGQPLPSADQENVNFDIKALDDYKFKFDLGIAPEFEVKGLSDKLKADKYLIQVDDEIITSQLDNGRRRLGTQSLVDADIVETDVIRISATEIHPTEGRQAYVGDFSVAIKDVAPEYQKDLLGKDKGHEIEFNVFELEGKDEAFIKKYYLNLEDGDEAPTANFSGKVTEINRIELAKINEDFLNQYFGEGEVKNEKEARNKIQDIIAEQYEKQTDPLLYRQLQDSLIAQNHIDLPNEFLKRWLVSSNEENTAEKVESEYENFSKGLKWSLIKSKVTEQMNIEISEEDIDRELANKIRQYMGMYADESYISTMIQRMKSDRKTVEQTAEELVDAKVFAHLKDTATLKDKKISKEEFEKIVEDYQNK